MSPEDAADPRGKDLFIALTETGICTLTGQLQKGVTIWALRQGLEEVRAAFGTRSSRTAKQRKARA